MFLSFSSNAYTKHDVYYAIKSISEIGYTGIELLIDHPHIFLPIQKKEIKKIKIKLENHNLLVSNLNANTVLGWHKNKSNKIPFEPSLSSTNSNLLNWRISYTKQAIDLANEFESDSISITSGILNKKKSVQQKIIFKNSLTEIANYAEKKKY